MRGRRGVVGEGDRRGAGVAAVGDVVRFRSTNPDLGVGCVLATGVKVAPAGPDLCAEIDRALARHQGGASLPEGQRQAVRDLLRHGGFKPTGRSKPASEYLVRAACQGAFPRIGNLVDAANLFSLDVGYPLSLVDLDRARAGAAALEIREGHPGEAFVFNAGGQAIDVGGLVGLAREGGDMIANPVKDSLATKLDAATQNVLAVLYTTRRLVGADALLVLARDLAARLGAAGGAERTDAWVLP